MSKNDQYLGSCELAICVRIEYELGFMIQIKSWIESAIYT